MISWVRRFAVVGMTICTRRRDAAAKFHRFLSLPFSRVCDPVTILGMFFSLVLPTTLSRFFHSPRAWLSKRVSPSSFFSPFLNAMERFGITSGGLILWLADLLSSFWNSKNFTNKNKHISHHTSYLRSRIKAITDWIRQMTPSCY